MIDALGFINDEKVTTEFERYIVVEDSSQMCPFTIVDLKTCTIRERYAKLYEARVEASHRNSVDTGLTD